MPQLDEADPCGTNTSYQREFMRALRSNLLIFTIVKSEGQQNKYSHTSQN